SLPGRKPADHAVSRLLARAPARFAHARSRCDAAPRGAARLSGRRLSAAVLRPGGPAMKIPVAVIAATLALAPVGTAGWRPTGRGSGAAKSKTLPGATVAPTGPTAPVTNHAVTLTWPASTFQSGGAVPAYELKRYAF